MILAVDVRCQHHLFDTLYHAVAMQNPDATLVTADRRYYDKARSEGQIIMLADWNPRHKDMTNRGKR